MFLIVFWLQKLTRAAPTDDNSHDPPSDGDEYECVQN